MSGFKGSSYSSTCTETAPKPHATTCILAALQNLQSSLLRQIVPVFHTFWKGYFIIFNLNCHICHTIPYSIPRTVENNELLSFLLQIIRIGNY